MQHPQDSAKRGPLPYTLLYYACKPLVYNDSVFMHEPRRPLIPEPMRPSIGYQQDVYRYRSCERNRNALRNEMNKWLEKLHVQYKVNDTWVPCAKYANLAWFEIKQEELDNGRIVYHRKITGLSREGIIGLYNKRCEA